MDDNQLEAYRIKHDPQEQQPVFQCEHCGKDMYENEEYYEYEGENLCEDCFDIQQLEDKLVAKKYVGED